MYYIQVLFYFSITYLMEVQIVFWYKNLLESLFPKQLLDHLFIVTFIVQIML